MKKERYACMIGFQKIPYQPNNNTKLNQCGAKKMDGLKLYSIYKCQKLYLNCKSNGYYSDTQLYIGPHALDRASGPEEVNHGNSIEYRGLLDICLLHTWCPWSLPHFERGSPVRLDRWSFFSNFTTNWTVHAGYKCWTWPSKLPSNINKLIDVFIEVLNYIHLENNWVLYLIPHWLILIKVRKWIIVINVTIWVIFYQNYMIYILHRLLLDF